MVSLSRAVLSYMLQKCSRSVGNARSTDAFKYILFKAKLGSGFALFSTNGELYTLARYIDDTLADMEFMLNYNFISSIVSSCASDADVSFELMETSVIIRSGNSVWKQPLFPTSNFPSVPTKIDNPNKVDRAEFLALVKDLPISADVSRPEISSLFYRGGKMFGNDGELVSSLSIDLGEVAFVIPYNSLSQITSLLKDDPSRSFSLSVSASMLQFTIGSDLLFVRTLDLGCIDYEEVLFTPIRATRKGRFSFDPDSLRHNIKQCNTVEGTFISLQGSEGASDLLLESFSDEADRNVQSKAKVSCDTDFKMLVNLRSLYNLVGLCSELLISDYNGFLYLYSETESGFSVLSSIES